MEFEPVYGPVVAVMGGSGFLSAHVVTKLTANNVQCRAAVAPGQSVWPLGASAPPWQVVDRDQLPSVQRFLDDAAALIICPDPEPHPTGDSRQWRRQLVGRLRRTLNACRKANVQRVIYLSSAATMITDEPLAKRGREESQVYTHGTAADPFVEAMAAAEAETYRYVAQGLDISLLLVTTMVGPGDVAMRQGQLMQDLFTGWQPRQDGQTQINLVDIRDVASAAVALLRQGRPGRRYAAAGQNLSLARLLRLAQEASETTGDQAAAAMPGPWLDPTGLGKWLEKARRALPGASDVLRKTSATGPGAWASRLMARAVAMGPVSNQRLRGELAVTPRPAATTIDDTWRWLNQVGALGWQRGRPRPLARIL